MVHVEMVAMILKEAPAFNGVPEGELIDQEIIEVVHVEAYRDNHHEHP